MSLRRNVGTTRGLVSSIAAALRLSEISPYVHNSVVYKRTARDQIGIVTQEVSGVSGQFSERSCEQIVAVSFPQVTEQFVARLADVPVPRILEGIVRRHSGI